MCCGALRESCGTAARFRRPRAVRHSAKRLARAVRDRASPRSGMGPACDEVPCQQGVAPPKRRQPWFFLLPWAFTVARLGPPEGLHPKPGRPCCGSTSVLWFIALSLQRRVGLRRLRLCTIVTPNLPAFSRRSSQEKILAALADPNGLLVNDESDVGTSRTSHLAVPKPATAPVLALSIARDHCAFLRCFE